MCKFNFANYYFFCFKFLFCLFNLSIAERLGVTGAPASFVFLAHMIFPPLPPD